MNRFTAQMALEALRNLANKANVSAEPFTRGDVTIADAAIAAIEADLAQPVELVWNDTSEAMLHLNSIESVLGGANGPTIRLRAIIAKNAAQPVEPMFWVRLCSDGCYEGPIHNSSIERVRKESGGWTPLYTAQQEPAGWQPIAMAPKDEKIIFACEEGIFIGKWGHYCVHNAPKITHWMPLPSAPKDAS